MSDADPAETGDASGSTGFSLRSIREGAIGGIAAYAFGYLLTYLWKAGEYRETIERIGPIAELFGVETPAPWRIVGWLFYNAHAVAAYVDMGITSTYIDLIARGDGPLEILYLVPPLSLAAAGYLVVRRLGPVTSVVEAIRLGPMVTIGYLPIVVVGVFAFRVNGSGPELVPSLLLAGIVYPIAFGGIGGAIAYAMDRR
ncbi:transporter [Halopenitus sp. H-Gu1]|uniref:transporter n=1 Tax=Halopenitus sp. H-Gu1 TaxID=3242697 RepID=UPI00359D4A57